MRLYDSLIEEDILLPDSENIHVYPYNADRLWPLSDDYELILKKDMAYELGAGACNSVNYTLVTSSKNFSIEDETVIFGRELRDIDGDTDYARIAIIRVKEDEELLQNSEKMYQLVSSLDFIKYHIFPKGYMLRNSKESNSEKVRIGKKELEEGMSFEEIGNTMIKRYKENPYVLSVKIIFVTDKNADFEGMKEKAKRATDIRRSLSLINKNLPTECSICDIRNICNEVEGLRELHFGKSQKDHSLLKVRT